jgi:hypothetical protein
MRFTATEAGFKDGLGGASNAKGAEEYHYVLFGSQQDPEHPENSGAYFEYDDQSNGAVNSVKAVSIGDKSVAFKLKGGKSIEVNCKVSAEQWAELKQGIRTVFPRNSVSLSGRRGRIRHKR